MNKLRLHFAVVILCCFSFLLMAAKFTFREIKVDLEVFKKPVIKVGDQSRHRLMDEEEFKKVKARSFEIK